jgi:ferredoxin
MWRGAFTTVYARETSYRVRPDLMNIIEKLGAVGISKCFDCGTCTVSCPFSEELGALSPRRIIKYVKLGLEDKLVASLEPWLCYYCGDCSDTCPKNAEPSETMMAVRRYLTIKYDFTGLSRVMYLTRLEWLLAIIIVGGITFLIGWLLKGPIVLERTELATFAPVHIVDTAGIIVFITLASILLINVYRMFKFSVGSLRGISLTKAFIEFIRIVPLHFFTQLRLAKCTFKNYWYIHLMIFYGYGLSFILFVPLLRLTLSNEPFLFVHPLSIAGILSAILLIVGTSLMIKGRLEKKVHVWRYSHHTDWMFIILLFLVTITGILTGVFRTLDYPLPTYISFALHIVLAAPFLILEVPFAKWSHLAYRPFAIYFYRLKLNQLRGGV